MPLSSLLNRPVTIIRRPDAETIDDYGSPLRTQEVTATVGELQQATRDEQAAHGDFSVTLWRLFLPADAGDLRAADAIVVDGDVYELLGDPWPVRNPRTRATSHIEATVKPSGARYVVDGLALWDTAIWDEGVWA